MEQVSIITALLTWM